MNHPHDNSADGTRRFRTRWPPLAVPAVGAAAADVLAGVVAAPAETVVPEPPR